MMGVSSMAKVRGYAYKANNTNFFPLGEKEGEVIIYRADDFRQFVYVRLNIISLAKNLKNPKGKKRFDIPVFCGEYFSLIQNPKVITPGNFYKGLAFIGVKMQKLKKVLLSVIQPKTSALSFHVSRSGFGVQFNSHI